MHKPLLLLVSATVGLVVISIAGRSSFAIQDPGLQQAGIEVQARGPVHEAFAEPNNTQPTPGPVVPKQPPALIDEMPPDQRPEGDNVQWIPGYWAWDDDTTNFLWVSGCWRAVPPGRSWMPGHWQEIDSGWTWVTGFWAPTNIQELQYLPPPPPSLDSGPSAPPPNTESLYAPGTWVYRENHYLWRPGHWYAHHPQWVWIPACYVWTPSGCLFVDDYWDHPLDECGLLFAPVRFDLAVWGRLNRPYVPQFVVQTDFLLGSLFVSGHHRHYYFGDYFDDRYAQRGFVAWTDYHPHAGVLDPHFAYYRQLHTSEPKWEPALRDLYRVRRAGEVARPPQTLNQQVQIVNNITNKKTTNVIVNKNINLTQIQNVTALTTLKDVHNTKVTGLGSLSQVKESKIPNKVVKVAPLPKAELTRENTMAKQMTEYANQRRLMEAKMLGSGGVPNKSTDPAKSAKMTIPKALPPVVMAPPVVRQPPPAIKLPKHEERPIPKYNPPNPPGPPKKDKKDNKDKKG